MKILFILYHRTDNKYVVGFFCLQLGIKISLSHEKEPLGTGELFFCFILGTFLNITVYFLSA